MLLMLYFPLLDICGSDSLTFITEHSLPSMLTIALKRQCAIAIDATWQADTLGAVCSCPAHLTGAAVGFCAVALAWDAVWVADGVLAVAGLVCVPWHASHLPTFVTNVVIILLKFKKRLVTTVMSFF